ncbi:MAG: hypothetical protein AAFY34_03235 [Pseudomonadota bacterium]
MGQPNDLITHALKELDISVVGILGWTGIHIDPYTPSRYLIRKASRHLKALENLVRRVILFMALQVDLEADIPAQSTSQRKEPKPIDLADGVELAEFPRAWTRRLKLMPPVLDGSDIPDFSGSTRKETPHFILAGRFSRRVMALHKVLKSREAYAKRLARSLKASRKRRDAAPPIARLALPDSMRSPLQDLNKTLAVELRSALTVWDSS